MEKMGKMEKKRRTKKGPPKKEKTQKRQTPRSAQAPPTYTHKATPTRRIQTLMRYRKNFFVCRWISEFRDAKLRHTPKTRHGKLHCLSLSHPSVLGTWDPRFQGPRNRRTQDPENWGKGRGQRVRAKKHTKTQKKGRGKCRLKKKNSGGFRGWFALRSKIERCKIDNMCPVAISRIFFLKMTSPAATSTTSPQTEKSEKICEQFHVENPHKQTSGDIFWRLVGEGGVILALPWPRIPSSSGLRFQRPKVPGSIWFSSCVNSNQKLTKKKGRNKCKNPQTVGRKFLLTFQSKKTKTNDYEAFWASGPPAFFFVLTFSPSFCRELFLKMVAVVWYFWKGNPGDCTSANLSLRFFHVLCDIVQLTALTSCGQIFFEDVMSDLQSGCLRFNFRFWSASCH